MKPLVRWTIGPVSELGHKILKRSVEKFKKIYPEFDCVVCYNNIEKKLLDEIDVDLFEQKKEFLDIQLTNPDDNVEEASGCGWKLCPVRLRIESHELWIDNDIVIEKRIPEIDEWLNLKTSGIITQGLGRKRMYGPFDKFIRQDLHLCAGLFGLPPNFDLLKSMYNFLYVLDGKTLGGYDEQGLTASVVSNMKNWIMIPHEKLCIIEDHDPRFVENAMGYHFTAANRKNWHRGWKIYNKEINSISLL